MADVNISKFRAQVVRDGFRPANPGFVESEGQNPVDPAGSGQNHLPVTIAPVSTGLAITESQVLGGAGTVAQYIRGDGSLADFPATTGGGSSVSYYLNGSISQGTIGGVAYKELNRMPIFGAGTDITTSSDGYIASFITDAGDPNKLEIPAGNWNLETYFSASSGGGNPTFYVELYKYNGTTFTLIASNASSPELIAFGTNLNPYFSTLAVPQTTLALTDRLALRYYVTTSGRTITLHTENDHLCQVITTFTTGLTALNGLTTQVQFFAVGTSGTDFNIASSVDTHTFNLPTASGTNRGALSSGDWTTFNNKENAITAGTTAQYFRGDKTFQTLNTSVVPEGTNLYYTEARVNANTNVAANTAARHNAVTLGTANGLSLSTQVLSLGLASAGVTGALSGTDWSTFNSKQNALTLTTTGTSGAATLVGSTLNIPQYQAAGTYVTAVTASSPLASSGGTTPNITIQQASGSQNGFLSSTDWTTFNNKQNALNGTGFVKISGTTISYDNTNYLPLTGGTLTGTLNINGLGYGNTLVITTSNTGGADIRLSNTSSGGKIYNITSTGSVNAIGAGGLQFYNETDGVVAFGYTSTRNFVINTSSDNGSRLRVNGTGFFDSTVTSTQFIANGNSTGGFEGLRIINASTGAAQIVLNNSAQSWLVNTRTDNNFSIFNNTSSTTPFFISTTGNVGIGTTAPIYKFEVSDGTRTCIINPNSILDGIFFGTKEAKPLIFGTTDSVRMTLTSGGNFGIGTTTPDTATNYATLSINGSSGGQVTWQSAGSKIGYAYSTSSNLIIGADASKNLIFDAGATERIRITSSGNVGIGITPSAWSGTLPVFQYRGSTLASFTNIDLHVLQNGYFDGSNWRYISNGAALLHRMNAGGDGSYTWFNSASGTAGNVISLNQAMTLTSGGNLLVGTTTDAGQRLQVNGTVLLNNGSGQTSLIGSAFTGIEYTRGSTLFGFIGTENSGSGGIRYNSIAGNFEHNFYSNGSLSLKINSGANLSTGNGASFTSWSTNGNIDLNDVYLSLSSSGSFGGAISNNAYFNSGWKYKAANNATLYQTLAGEHRFFTAGVGGAAGNAISFTQAFTINASGNVLIGTTTDNGYKLNNTGNTWSNGVRIGRDFSISNRATVRLDSNGDHPADILFGRTPAALQSSWDGVFWSLSSRGSGESNVFNIYRGSANTGGTEVVVLSCNPSGNVLIGTTTDVGARLHVNGAVRTGAPSGGSAVDWRLGTARGGTITPNAIVRVEIGGVLVDLDARYV